MKSPIVEKIWAGAVQGFGIFFGWSLAAFALDLALKQLGK